MSSTTPHSSAPVFMWSVTDFSESSGQSHVCQQCRELLDNMDRWLDTGGRYPFQSRVATGPLSTIKEYCQFCRTLEGLLPKKNWETELGTHYLEPIISLSVSNTNGCVTPSAIITIKLGPRRFRYLLPTLTSHYLTRDHWLYGTKLQSKVDMGTIGNLICICQSCSTKPNYYLEGFRAIDCRTRSIRTLPENEAYVALSYVWGQTSSSDIVIPEDTTIFPQTIEDAMSVSLALGIQYLWVDRYCISQNDEKERHRLIQNMDLVYMGADVTIIAAAGSGPHYGLPGVSRARHPQESVYTGKHELVVVYSPRDEIRDSVWWSRGWTYQEMVLSRRKLVFMDSQVYFQCATGHHTDIMTTKGHQSAVLSSARSNFRAFSDRSASIWDHLELYYKKNLTFDTDRLNAFYGIFSAYSASGVITSHFWGIPYFASTSPISSAVNMKSVTFVGGLLWIVRARAEIRQCGGPPSWSWTSFHTGDLDAKLIRRYVGSVEEIAVTLTRHDGELVDLENYNHASHDYTNFHPWIRVTTWTSRTRLQSDLNGAVEEEDILIPGTLALDPDTYLPAGSELTAVYLGHRCEPRDELYGTENSFCPLFLLVAGTEQGHFRRIGVWNSTCKDGWPHLWRSRDIQMETGHPDGYLKWERRTITLI